MIVSVHLPKTAGSSFRSILQAHYGPRLLLDYDDQPMGTPAVERNANAERASSDECVELCAKYDCIHGHFLPLKYLGIKNAQFVTWLRDPVERVVSRYFFSRRKWENDGEMPQHPQVRALFDAKQSYPSLEEFVKLPAFQNTYAQYFWGFSLDNFALVGFVETWDKSLTKFAESLGFAADLDAKTNTNPDRDGEQYELDPNVRALIEALNAEDVKIYEAARARFG